jgi:hypothetical protein
MSDVRRLLFSSDTRKMEILNTPVNRLDLKLRTSLLAAPLERLYARLKRRGIRLKPDFYFGEDWGCVAVTTNIEIGFYDATPVLKELNREVRGWVNDARTVDYLLRHETGHAFCYAHRLYKLPEFRKVFGVKGSFFETYPLTDRFKPHPWSRDYVNPNRDHYAQKHPDEDFAETFGVWLSLPSNWKRAYKNRRGALGKLEYVTRLVERYGGQAPQVPPDLRAVDVPVEMIRETVAEILGTSLTRYRSRATGYIDPLLKRVGRYRKKPADPGLVALSDVIGAHRKSILDALVRSAKVTPATAASIVSKMETRSRILHLSVPLGRIDKALIDVSAVAVTLATRFAMTGKVLLRK